VAEPAGIRGRRQGRPGWDSGGKRAKILGSSSRLRVATPSRTLCLGAWFGDVVRGASRQGFDGDARAARSQGTAHDDGDAAIDAANAGENFEAVHAGHLDVEQDEVGVNALEGGEAFLAAGGGGGDFDGRLRLEDHAQEAAHDGGVIDMKDAYFA
jgi:hypothetical protein